MIEPIFPFKTGNDRREGPKDFQRFENVSFGKGPIFS